MDRKLIDYLPIGFTEILEFKALFNAEEPELANFLGKIENIDSDQFISTATEEGIARYEKMLNITPKGSEPLNIRRFKILTRFNEQLPYTVRTLEERLEVLCGKNGYMLEFFPSSYAVRIRIALASKTYFDAVYTMLKRIVPANIEVDLQLKYNQHRDLSKYSHKTLASLRHKHMKDEVIA